MASNSETSPIGEKARDYYEKDGLRTYGDDADHDHEPPVSLSLEND